MTTAPTSVAPSAPRTTSRPFRTVLTVAVLTAAIAFWAMAPTWTTVPLLALANLLATLAFLTAAVLLSDEPRQVRNAVLLAGIGLFWTIGYVANHPVGPLPVLEWVAGPMVFPLLATALLRYPEPALGRTERTYVTVLAVTLGGLGPASVAVSRPQWHPYPSRPYPADAWWPAIHPDPALSDAVATASDLLWVALAAAFLALLVRRFRRAAGLDRRLLAPVAVAGVAIGVVVACEVSARLLPAALARLPVVFGVEAAVMLAVPASFLVSAVRRRLHRVIVSDLVLSLGRPTPEEVEAALRRALADPELQILYWVPEFAGHVATGGLRVDEATVARRLRRTITSDDGTELAVVLVDPAMHRHPEVLDATLSATTMWLENGRLQAAVRAQLEDVRQSRERLRRAGEAERRRIERDLHDGAQQRLLALKLRLAVAGVEAGSAAERELIDSVTAELQDAVTELRDLARGLHPEVLARRGLHDAVHDVADRSPLAVAVSLPDRRWADEIEAAAYFVVCEALSNTLKHADATRVTILGSDVGDRLRLEISDDGNGRAAVEPGGGLAGVQDRVLALDGTLDVDAGTGGTRLLVTLPAG